VLKKSLQDSWDNKKKDRHFFHDKMWYGFSAFVAVLSTVRSTAVLSSYRRFCNTKVGSISSRPGLNDRKTSRSIQQHNQVWEFDSHSLTSIAQHDEQCTYEQTQTLRRVREIVLAVESNNYFRFWVCVRSLRYPALKAHVAYFIVMCGLPSCTMLFNILS
jgi:hypothetical protein